jgi:alcohol dehydrogenase
VFQVRFHGRGGQGVVTAAELLAAAAFSDGRHAQASPSFGSEWMGAPVMSFCRIDGKPIRTHEPVSEPDALVIQDPTLLHQADLFAGLGHDGYLLINSTHGFEVPEPEITDDGDVILRVDATTICGTDLHILAGDVPEVRPGRILGHEAVGTVVEAGEGVHTLAPGERVLVSCISACGTCQYCRQGRYGQCLAGGGWILGHKIDGTQAEYVRVPFADTSTFRIPAGVTDEEALMLADILPTGYEVGVLAGGVRPGDVVAVVGTGPVGLSAITCAQLFSPSHIVAIDRSDARLDAAKQFGADVIVNNTREDPLAVIRELTGRLGADVSIEAVGTPATFELAVSLIRPSGRIANIGVHGRQGRHDPPGAHVQ